MTAMRKTRSEGTLQSPTSAKKFAPPIRRLPLSACPPPRSVLGQSRLQRTSSDQRILANEQRTSLNNTRTPTEQRNSLNEQRTSAEQRVSLNEQRTAPNNPRTQSEQRTTSEQRASLHKQQTSSEHRKLPNEQRTPLNGQRTSSEQCVSLNKQRMSMIEPRASMKQRVFGTSAAQDDSLTSASAASSDVTAAAPGPGRDETRRKTGPTSGILRKTTGGNVGPHSATSRDSVSAMKAAVHYADTVTRKMRTEPLVQDATDLTHVVLAPPYYIRNKRNPRTTNTSARVVDADAQKKQQETEPSVHDTSDSKDDCAVWQRNSVASRCARTKSDSASAAPWGKSPSQAPSTASHSSDSSSAGTASREVKACGRTPKTSDDAAPVRDSETNKCTATGARYRDWKAGHVRTSKAQEAEKAGPCQKGLMHELQSLERKYRILQSDLTQERKCKSEIEAMYKQESEVAREQAQIAEDAAHQTLLARKAHATEMKNLTDELEFLKKSSKEKEEALRAELDITLEEHATEKEVLKIVSAKNLKEVKKRQSDTKKHMASKEEVAHAKIVELSAALLTTKQKLKLAKQAYKREERERSLAEQSLEQVTEAAVRLETEGQRVAGELEITALKLRASEEMCKKYEDGSFDPPVDSSHNEVLEQQQLEMKREMSELRLELTAEKEKSDTYSKNAQEAADTMQQLLTALKEVEFQRDQHELNLQVAEETLRMNLVTQHDIRAHLEQCMHKSYGTKGTNVIVDVS